MTSSYLHKGFRQFALNDIKEMLNMGTQSKPIKDKSCYSSLPVYCIREREFTDMEHEFVYLDKMFSASVSFK